MKVIEGWIYEYCLPFAGDCHVIISKKKITDEVVEKHVREIAERRDDYGEYVSFWKKNIMDKWKRSKTISWELFLLWIMEDEGLVKIMDDILKEYKGKKVKITIDVIEEG